MMTTLLHRPYVFAFLISFLVIGFLNRGIGRTLLFLCLGFGIAFLSEFSSIRNGFPYGPYHYVYENLQGELVFGGFGGGVPVWDSLSYSFLAYASYEMAAWLRPTRPSTLTGATFMTLLDVVVDPLAVRGDRWFLGKVFYYPHGGIYFGVPLSNFLGWFLVGWLILSAYQFLERRLPIHSPPPPLYRPLFYWGILLFNLAITFWIGEIVLGLTGLAIHLVVTSILFLGRKKLAVKS